MKRLNLKGRVFGRLTILEEKGKLCNCLCSCGNIKTALRGNILAGYTTSCGCLQKEATSKANFKHGHSTAGVSPTYTSWKAMWSRVRNPQKDHAERYIERGIDADPRWQCFETFLKDMGERPLGLELDRIDNSKGYWPDNCRWVTHKVNCNNKG